VSRRLWVHAGVALGQLVLAVPALLWWSESVLFVIGLSLFANFYSAVSAVEAADDRAVLQAVADAKDELLAELRKVLGKD